MSFYTKYVGARNSSNKVNFMYLFKINNGIFFLINYCNLVFFFMLRPNKITLTSVIIQYKHMTVVISTQSLKKGLET